ncbi:MAG: type II toxin-antitoxin system MqsA family antitoxin [Dehalococcoidia bacterium]
MRCQECGQGETRTGMTTVPLQLGSAVVLVKGVPSDICDACGKFFIDTTTSQQLLRIAQEAADRGDGVTDYRIEAAE